jgi:prevent-host-death family protein
MTHLTSTLPANEARTNFYQILDEASQGMRQFVVTLRGKAQAVIMSAEEFEGWVETLEIASNKKLSASIRKGLSSKKRYTQAEADKILGC